MGGDGGSIPGRQDLVRLKKKKEVAEKNAELAAAWRHCALSQNPLSPPIVACEKGRLYNKESLLEHLLEKPPDSSIPHVRGLKDVKELRLTPNPAFKDPSKEANGVVGGEYVDPNVAMFGCPVIGLEMNGRWRFVFHWSCGCVVSEKAQLELAGDKCHKCGGDVDAEDVVVINGTQEDGVVMETRMAARRERAKAEKKMKKRRLAADGSGAVGETKGGVGEAPLKVKKGIKEGDSVDDEKRKKLGKTRDKSLVEKKKKKTVQDDPTKSEVYKSLFTSHKDAKTQDTAHWVTMNPGYFR